MKALIPDSDPQHREEIAVKPFWISFAALIVLLLFILFWPLPVHSQVPSITKMWTAPGDDGAVGTATSYEMRYSTARPDTTSTATFTSWWNAATVVSGMPTPLISGTTQSVVVAPTGGFLTGRTYYFVIRSTDDAGNISGFSNVASTFLADTDPPRTIIDLR